MYYTAKADSIWNQQKFCYKYIVDTQRYTYITTCVCSNEHYLNFQWWKKQHCLINGSYTLILVYTFFPICFSTFFSDDAGIDNVRRAILNSNTKLSLPLPLFKTLILLLRISWGLYLLCTLSLFSRKVGQLLSLNCWWNGSYSSWSFILIYIETGSLELQHIK